ncbi:AimR family lysis-lysogeny pheromone receptor [Bacillus mycoides]|uniref:AimR family lysis-lysogeny pheromone receptor n=1 Tax=Bacillus mycoides TaxID=1405 RepID=UPI0035564BA7
MQALLNKLHTDLYAAGITNEALSEIWGVSPSNVSRVFNGHTQISFCFLTKTLIRLYEDHLLRRDIVQKYLQFAKPENIKEAMEYFSFRGEFEMLHGLIAKEKERVETKRKEKEKKEEKYTPGKDEEWIGVYELIYRRNTEREKFSLEDFDDLLEEKRFETSSKEMEVLIDILRCQTAYQLRDYRTLLKRMKKIEKRVSKVTNKFLRTSFSVRLKEGMNAVLLMDAKVLEIRENSFKLLEICSSEPNFKVQKANAHYNIAESYIFENFTQSKFHFEQALHVLGSSFNEELQRKKRAIERTFNFLKIYHSKELDNLYGDLDLPEQAFLAIRKGDKELALVILEKIKEEKGSLNEFSTFYLGLAKEDVRIIEKSLEMFIANSNNFYAKLPKIHLGID